MSASEVHFGNEPGKSGIEPAQVPALADFIACLPGLRLRGLMSIPPLSDNSTTQRLAFRRLRKLFEELKNRGYDLDTLSMGMSDDFEAAILEGATLIRTGTAIFGTRATKHS